MLAAVEMPAEELSRSSAVGVRERDGAVQNIGLLCIIRCHLPAAFGETLFQTRQYFGIAPESHPQRFGHGLASEIVFRRAESSTEDQDVGTEQSVLGGSDQSPHVVTHNALENYIDAQK